MIEPFERVLTDWLADRLVPGTVVTDVARAGTNTAALDADEVRVEVRIRSAQPAASVGDDRDERFGSRETSIRTRPVLQLSGEVEVRVRAVDDTAARRRRLLEALDAVLLVTRDASLRSGRAFLTDREVHGFALDQGFLIRGAAEDDAGGAYVLTYAYGGRFWPVEQPAAGPPIAADGIQIRLASLPVQLPAGLVARVGGGPVDAAIVVGLQTSGADAPNVLGARLLGSDPPGSLVGNADAPTTGYVGISGDTQGRFTVRFVPDPALAAPDVARIELMLTGEDRRRIVLGVLHIEVLP